MFRRGSLQLIGKGPETELDERKGFAQSRIEGACRACGATYLLDRHHVNWNHDDNSSGNLMLLCKYCHMKATHLGVDGFAHLIKVVDNNPALRIELGA